MSEKPIPAECTRLLLSESQIQQRVIELGAEVAQRHQGHRVHLITVLRGGLFFLADLCRAIPGDVVLDFMAVSAYSPGQGGAVRVTKDLSDDIGGAHVVLVEDVVDTGLTVNYVLSLLGRHKPASLEVCTLLDKPARRIAQVPIDYTGFSLSDHFVVGYGLDLKGRYRNLPYVAELHEDAVFA